MLWIVMPGIPIIISLAIGLLIVCAALPFNDRSMSTLLMWICLAFGLGSGVSSSLYFLWLVIVGSAASGFIALEITIVGALILYLYRYGSRGTISMLPPLPAKRSSIYRIITIAFGMLLT